MLAHTRRTDPACFPAPFLLGESQSSRDIRRAEFVPLQSMSAPAPWPAEARLADLSIMARSSCRIVMCCVSMRRHPQYPMHQTHFPCACKSQPAASEANGRNRCPRPPNSPAQFPLRCWGAPGCRYSASTPARPLRWPRTFTLGCASIGASFS